MRITFIGQKGIPATFGGVEYHVDELTKGLASADHEVSAYVRAWYTSRDLQNVNGVRLIHIPTIKTKHLDASVHSFLCSIHALFQKNDIIHYHAIGPSFFSMIPKLFGKKVVSTVHRLDWQTEKWGKLARFWLRIAELIAVRVPDKTIVVSEDLRRYFLEKHGKSTIHISHGIDVPPARPVDVIKKKHGLAGMDYVLFMGRLVPEKRVDWLIESFQELKQRYKELKNIKLVIAGGSSSTDGYVQKLRNMSEGSSDTMFTGYVSGIEKEELLSNALVLVLPSYLEGFPIILLEAKSYGVCCLASDISPHKEAIRSGIDGVLFDSVDRRDLTLKLKSLVSNPQSAEMLGRTAREEMGQRPSWEAIVGMTVDLYEEVLNERDSSSGGKPQPLS